MVSEDCLSVLTMETLRETVAEIWTADGFKVSSALEALVNVMTVTAADSTR